MTKKMIPVLIVLFILSLITFSFAQRPGVEKAKNLRNLSAALDSPIMKFLQELNLTPEQKAQVAQIIEKNREALHNANSNIATKKRELNQAIVNEEDKSSIDTKVNDLINAEKESLNIRVGMQTEIMKILTPEQKEQLKGKIEGVKTKASPAMKKIKGKQKGKEETSEEPKTE